MVKNQPNRLGTETRHQFHGSAIDRTKPIKFTLDGRVIEGFHGDTVLSAALASGIDAAGTHLYHAIALGERFAPVVMRAGKAADAQAALPMERMPAKDGLELVTLGHAVNGGVLQRIETLFRGPSHTLGLALDKGTGLAGPWFDEPASETLRADLLIVGGGVAGLSAARVAALAGERVILVDRRAALGGDAAYFGAFGDEEAPEKLIARLAEGLSHSNHVTILTRTDAFALVDGGVRAHQVVVDDSGAKGRVIDIKADRIVLATGALERLPVFPGNRSPGVVGSVAAFHRASRYGIWLGRKAAISTASSSAYRLAMKASDAGVDIFKVADIRVRPQSRFIEFSKAYGIVMAPGLFVDGVSPGKAGLSVRFDVAIEGVHQEIEPVLVDQLLVCGGWQPDLTLWHMAGGASRWVPHSSQLQARGKIDGIELAGAAAGYLNTSACVASGQAAASWLFGRSAADPVDPVIDAIYEMPDAATPIARPGALSSAPTYLDSGRGLTTRPATEAARGWVPFGRHHEAGPPPLAQQAHGFGICEIAASVQLGNLPERAAGVVARERSVSPCGIGLGGQQWAPNAETEEQPSIPAYLHDRFGPTPRTWVITSADGRQFDAGCLVYVNSDSTDPRHAVGVVIGRPASGDGSLALIGRIPAATGDRLVAKDISGAVPIKLGEMLGE